MDLTKPLYIDNLVELFNDRIVVKEYYFPFGNPKIISLVNITGIKCVEPTLTNGKYRMWGSGNFVTWFPMDSNRSRRDKIFILTLSSQKIKPAVTVVNSAEFESALKKKNLL